LTSGGTSSVSIAVPTGTVDVVYNTSASVAYCTYGSSGVAATSSSDVIQANSWVAFTVPSGATTIACISPSGNLSINVSGGSGLPTGSGGGGSGGGGSNASVGSTGSSPPSSGTYLAMNVGGNLTGVTGTTNGLKIDSSGVTQPVSAASLPLPSGAATAANQPALNADGGALGHITNFPATQPISGYAAVPTSGISIARPANVTEYNSSGTGQGWCSVTSACTSVFTWANACKIAGGSVFIPEIDIYSNNNPASTAKLQGALFIFSATPGTIISDGAAFSIAAADFANLTGGSFNGIAFTLASVQASGAVNSGVSLTGSSLGLGGPLHATCASGSTTLYGMAEVTNAYTPASGETLTVIPHFTTGIN
jgi:hypothetical protein